MEDFLGSDAFESVFTDNWSLTDCSFLLQETKIVHIQAANTVDAKTVLINLVFIKTIPSFFIIISYIVTLVNCNYTQKTNIVIWVCGKLLSNVRCKYG